MPIERKPLFRPDVMHQHLDYKGADQLTYERFDVETLADNEHLLRQFVFLLGADRVVPVGGRSHLYDLLAESEKVGRDLTKKFYVQYGDMRQDAFARLCQDNPQVPPMVVLADTQKLLDRVLFCAFAEDRGLLPVDTIQKAYVHPFEVRIFPGDDGQSLRSLPRPRATVDRLNRRVPASGEPRGAARARWLDRSLPAARWCPSRRRGRGASRAVDRPPQSVPHTRSTAAKLDRRRR